MRKKTREMGYYLGVDVGLAMEPTALALVARDFNLEGEDYPLVCSYIQTLSLGATYPDVARRISEIEKELFRRGAHSLKVLVDVTGQGQPVIDLIRRGLESELISAQFTSGAETISQGQTWRISKEELITYLKIILQTGRLQLPGKTKDSDQERTISEMVLELQGFNPKKQAEDVMEVKTGARDNMATALGLAMWLEREWRVTGHIGGVSIEGVIAHNLHGW